MNKPKYPGKYEVINGNGAVARVMNLVCGGVIGYPITPSTEISETFQLNVASGQKNVWGRHPFFFEPEGEHSAQSGAMGAALTGGKYVSNASSSQGILYAMESHFVSVGKRIGGFVLQVASRVVSRHSLNVMGGHDDVYSLLPAGYTVLFGVNPEEAADLALISYRVASLSLIPVANCMDGFSTSHMLSEARMPGEQLVKEYLGDPGGYIPCPTVAQEILYGAAGRAAQFGAYMRAHRRELSPGARVKIDAILAQRSEECEADAAGELFDAEIAAVLAPDQVAAWRRQWVNAPVKGTRKRVPALVDVDNPGMTGCVQNQPDFQAGVADQRTHFLADVPRLARQAMEEYNALTGRNYQPVQCFGTQEADYVFIALGSVCEDILAVLPYLRRQGLKVGLVQVTLLQPFPEAEVVAAVSGAKQVVVLERSDLAALAKLVDGALMKATQNAANTARGGKDRFPGIPAVDTAALPLVSIGFFGIGGHDLQPRHLIAAARAMAAGELPVQFYLGSTFFDSQATGVLKEIQDRLREAYPETERMSLEVGENPPDLLAPGTLRIRFHSIGGYGTIATGKLLADILAEVLGLHSKAAPKYGSEKSGAPTNYYITLSPEPVKITNAQLEDVEIVVSPDHMVFSHDNPLRGLCPGGTFIIQSDKSPRELWACLPQKARETIRERGINLIVLDAFGVAKRFAPTPGLQTRMMGVAFIGAIVAKVDRVSSGVSKDEMLAKIREQIEGKFAHKGSRVVEANMQVIAAGAAQAQLVNWRDLEADSLGAGAASGLNPGMNPGENEATLAANTSGTQGTPGGKTGGKTGDSLNSVKGAVSSETRENNQGGRKLLPVISTGMCQRGSCPKALTGGLFDRDYFDKIMGEPFARGKIGESAVYPGMGFFLPPASAADKDKGMFRLQMPVFHAEACTGCMECALVCPDAAIPNTAITIASLLETAVQEVGALGAPLLARLGEIEAKMREILLSRKNRVSFAELFQTAARMVWACCAELVENSGISPDVNGVESANSDTASSGAKDTNTANSKLANDGNIADASQQSPQEMRANPEVEAAIAAVSRVLDAYPVARTRPFFDAIEKKSPGAGVMFATTIDPWKCTGCLECVSVCAPGALVATPQDDTILETAKQRFAFLAQLPNSPASISDPNSGPTLDLKRILLNHDNYYATVGGHGACRGCGEVTAIRQTMSLANEINRHRVENHRSKLNILLNGLREKRAQLPNDAKMREFITGLIARLEHRLYRYEGPGAGRGPAGVVIANSTGCSSVYASTAPWNSYREPWVNSLFQDAQPLAKGMFEGLAADLSPDILAIRQANAILDGVETLEQLPQDPPLWQQFTTSELELLPNVMCISGDGAAYDIGFGALSRVLSSGTPIKTLVLDTGAYSNTGGQASTASFAGQDADLSRYAHFLKGKDEQRKELALLAAMHPGVLVVATNPAFQMHFLKNVAQALNQVDYPVVIDVYTPCQPEHGIGDDQAAEHSKMAVKSRVSPLFVHEPGGEDFPDRFLLDGNPEAKNLWARNKIAYVDETGTSKTWQTVYTPADFAFSEGRFRKHFTPLSCEAPHPAPIAEFIELSAQDREEHTPFIYATDREGHLVKYQCSPQIVRLTEQCKDYWTFLQYLAGQDLKELRKTKEKLEQELAKLRENASGASSGSPGTSKPENPGSPVKLGNPATGKSGNQGNPENSVKLTNRAKPATSKPETREPRKPSLRQKP